MKVCGVVAEYNPFHNGHLYQLKEARLKTGADVIVVAMSGNFLQRGEPAIVDKWDRASVALKHGADIVVEIPAAFSVQPADIFAKGAVDLLTHMGMDTLSFGSESGEGSDFEQAASLYLGREKEINDFFHTEQKQGLTYAQNMSDILSKHFPDFKLDLTQPNNTLGFAYAKVLRENKRPVNIETVHRKSSHYHDQEVVSGNDIASATAIRNLLFSERDWTDQNDLPLPLEMEEILKTRDHVQWAHFFPYLKYRVTTMSLAELSQIYLMEKGLEYRVKEVVKQSDDMNAYMTRLKTKQLSWTRLQRLSYYILLNQTEADMTMKTESVEFIRLLGFNKTGQKHLNQIKHDLNRPLVTNISQKNRYLLAYDIMAGEVYGLASPGSRKSQDYKRKPLKID